jgi:hypothetical protein
MTGGVVDRPRVQNADEFTFLRLDIFKKIFLFIDSYDYSVEDSNHSRIEFNNFIAMEIEKILRIIESELSILTVSEKLNYAGMDFRLLARFILANFDFSQEDAPDKLDALCFDVFYLAGIANSIFSYHGVNADKYADVIGIISDRKLMDADQSAFALPKGNADHSTGDKPSGYLALTPDRASRLSRRTHLRRAMYASMSLDPPAFVDRDAEKFPTAEGFLKHYYHGRLGISGDLTQSILSENDPALLTALQEEFGKERAHELRQLVPLPTLRETNDRRLFEALGYVPEGKERNSKLTILNRGQRVGIRLHPDRWTRNPT